MNVTTNHLTVDMYILHSHKPTSFLKQVRQAYEVPPRLPVSPHVVLLCACPVILPPSMVSKPPFHAHLSSIRIQLSCLHNVLLCFKCIKSSLRYKEVKNEARCKMPYGISLDPRHWATTTTYKYSELGRNTFKGDMLSRIVTKKNRTLKRMLKYIDLNVCGLPIKHICWIVPLIQQCATQKESRGLNYKLTCR